jgi:hypothetical protein
LVYSGGGNADDLEAGGLLIDPATLVQVPGDLDKLAYELRRARVHVVPHLFGDLGQSNPPSRTIHTQAVRGLQKQTT